MNAPKKRPLSAREIAGKVVHDVLSTDLFSNRRLSELLTEGQLATRDRNFCAELVYGTLRWALPLEDSLRSALERPGKIPPRVMAHWLVAAYQLQHLTDTIPTHAAVNETVSMVKRFAPGLSGLTNAILRKLGSPKHEMLVFSKASTLEIAKAYGLPIVLVDGIFGALPESEREAAVKSFNGRPDLYFRLHTAEPKSIDEIIAHSFVPGAYHAQTTPGLAEKMSESDFVVQDPASQVAALLLAPAKGSKVVDMCAAPGMKSLILKSLVGESGTVLAVDSNPAKKARMADNMKRLKLPLEIKIADARMLGQDDALKGAFDSVMLDAPCSGLGTIRRHPEIRFRHSGEKMQANTALQRELLASASALVKSGGTLVYSVCSTIEAEGKEQIEWFLANHKGFRLDDPKQVLPWLLDNAITAQNHVLLWPHRHDSDGFFAARLIKS